MRLHKACSRTAKNRMKSVQCKNLVTAWAFLLIGLAGRAGTCWRSKTFIERDSRTHVQTQLKDTALRIQHDLDRHAGVLQELHTQFLLKKKLALANFPHIASTLATPAWTMQRARRRHVA